MEPTASSQARQTGIRASMLRAVAHARAIARLEQELARTELQRKGATVGAGTGAAVAAAILALYALAFGLAALAALLALLVDWWLALLIVFLLLVAAVAGLVLAARSLVRAGTPLKPEQAIEEARLTRDTVRRARAG